MKAERIRRRWRWIASLAAAALLIALVAWLGRAGGAQQVSAMPGAAAGVTTPPSPVQPPAKPAAPLDRATLRKRLLDQVQLADQTYCSYLHATAYPYSARPVSEQPDQIWPNTPVTELRPMHEEGGDSNSKVQLQTSQSRVYLGAGESVQLALRALDEHGDVLPLTITGALAQGLVFHGARPAPQVALQFAAQSAERGLGADSAAVDGIHSAVLTPSQTSLAGFDGTIRVRVRYSAAGRASAVDFDVIHTPQAPAVWSGQVREALEDGSLNFYLRLDVRQAGRYVISGRIDDGRGAPVALLTFNDLLPAGPGEVKLGMFGKLVRDHTPAMPLTLRDVDGYQLRENLDPDRATMPRLTGRVHTSRSYPLKQFSDAEWQSPERSRYLTELGNDMRRARAALSRLDPTLSLAPPCKAR